MNIKPHEKMPPVLAYLVVKEMLRKTLRCSMLHDGTSPNIISGSWPHDQQFCAHMIGRLACRFGTFMIGSYDIDMTKRGDMLHGLAHPCTLLLTHLLRQAHSTDNLGAIKAIEFKHRLLKWFQNAYTPLPDGHPGCRGSCATNYGQHFRKLKKTARCQDHASMSRWTPLSNMRLPLEIAVIGVTILSIIYLTHKNLSVISLNERCDG